MITYDRYMNIHFVGTRGKAAHFRKQPDGVDPRIAVSLFTKRLFEFRFTKLYIQQLLEHLDHGALVLVAEA